MVKQQLIETVFLIFCFDYIKPMKKSIKKTFASLKKKQNLCLQVNLCCLSGDGHTKPKPRRGNLPEPSEYKCLIRATLGNKKLSTVVSIEM